MKRLFAVTLVLTIAATLFAQDRGGPATIEDAFLRQQIEIQILRSQARSTDRDAKLFALETVREMYENGRLDQSTELFDIVRTLATEGTSNQVRQAGRIVNNFPVVRKEAAALLGDIGGADAQRVLLLIVREDPEPMVLAEAVYALGKVGALDNADEVADHIVFTLTRENARISPDNNLALATLLGLERLFESGLEFRDPIQLQNTIGLIIDMSTNYRYITIVRNRAQSILSTLIAR